MSISALKDNYPSHKQQDDFSRMVSSRRSVRAFLPDPVDQALIRKLFTLAALAPSNCNTQPWLPHVVSGAKRDLMRDALMKTVGEGENQLDFPYEGKYDGVYRQRQLEVGIMRYQAIGATQSESTFFYE